MKFNRFFAVFAVLLLVGAMGAYAQTTASLTGTVTMGGNPLPGATITISSPNMQGTRVTNSDVNGNYNFGNLPPGTYTVKYDMESMQTVTRTVVIGLGTTARSDAEMKLSAVAESITVTASSPAVLETTEVETNISANLIENLPIGRTLLATVNLAPGVNSNGPGGATTISGAYAYDSTYYVDGAVVNEVLRGQPQNLFIEDAIQETTVQTGAISAEYGRFTGGVVQAISKSGGNEFSGTLRDSLTNPTWTTQGALKEDRPDSQIQNQYEATLGGRIIRDRLWFFAAGRQFDRSTQSFFAVANGESPIPYPFTDKEQRVEGKLTGQITAKHTIVGSYFDIKRDQTNYCSFGCLEQSALVDKRSLPNSFYSFAYNGIITNNFLIEANYAKQNFSFVNAGGPQGPPESASSVYVATLGTFAGAPVFCGNCSSPEQRNNKNGKAKGSYFLSSKGLGTHNISFGVEDYQDMLQANNHQSGSDFELYTFNSPTRDANGNLILSMSSGNGLIIWWDILAPSLGNNFETKSAFANDKWDLNSHLSFNVGVRYDTDTGENEAHLKVANDSKVSPRLGVTYDVFGNGRLRANASYSQYASKIANGNVGDASSAAGQPSYLYWVYYGPDINNVSSAQLQQQVFNWFRSVGFTSERDNGFAGGGSAGIQTQILGKLKSPGVDEYTIGLGGQIGTNGFLRGDYQYRKWNNFYGNVVDQSTGTVFDPLANLNVDLNLVTNSNDFSRVYRAVLLQGGYRFFSRLNLGANYTYSTLKGNIVGESSGAGPGTANVGSQYYPEFFNYARNNPSGYLPADQRHKGRAWLSYDMPSFLGNFNFSVLENYDSGLPYSAVGSIFVVGGSRCPTCTANTFGYKSVTATTTGNYYFSDRGAFRTDNIEHTDLAVNYYIPISKAQLFVEGEMINAFNRQGAVSVNTTVLTANNGASCKQTANPTLNCTSFNPFTTTPVEGVNYKLGPNFGKAVNPTNGSVAGDFQLPRTYRVSFGVKF